MDSVFYSGHAVHNPGNWRITTGTRRAKTGRPYVGLKQEFCASEGGHALGCDRRQPRKPRAPPRPELDLSQVGEEGVGTWRNPTRQHQHAIA